MTTDEESIDQTMLSPDAAFSVLGEETRMQIIQSLGEADGSLPFTELREQVGLRQGSQFNYHLDKLLGHFVEKTTNGYNLTQRGRRVVEAVLSGAVTDNPVMEPTPLDQECYHCGAPVAVGYHQERVGLYCTECAGNYGESTDRDEAVDEGASGLLGDLRLPPAGVQGRSPEEVLSAAFTWGDLQFMARGSGICPRCSAALEEAVDVCPSHDPGDGVCPACNNRYAVQHQAHCTNCIYTSTGLFMLSLLATTELLAFLTARGLNPITTDSELAVYAVTGSYDEEIISTDPFKARFTFTVDEDAITLTVDDDLTVVAVTKDESAN